MDKTKITFSTLIVLSMLLLSACSGTKSSLIDQPLQLKPKSNASMVVTSSSNDTQVVSPIEDNTLLAAYEGALENIYTSVGPGVVNVSVTLDSALQVQETPSMPFFGNPDTTTPQHVLGSGFVWDNAGHIVTNNHVVDGADKIEVTFQDGMIVPASIVGTDPYSDLAVLLVDVPANLNPVQLADSRQVKVGQLAVAIGNPFGLEGTMTVGIISALGRSLPASESTNLQSPVFSIPDIIQTDAPINPGNSGGVLVNDQGDVVGVTAAIESPINANAGIGFAIPSNIVQKVIPALIENGHYDHPYLGISGMTLTSALAQAMDLDPSQRGALVEEVILGAPADDAGIQPSTRNVTIEGQDILVGGDVIVAIDGQPIQKMDDLIAYLTENTIVGQKVTLTIIRGDKEKDVDVILDARPNADQQAGSFSQSSVNNEAYLGISGITLSAEIAKGMDLQADQTGVLVEVVQADSPADLAGLHGSHTALLINGEKIMVGGDVITGFDNKPVKNLQDLVTYLSISGPGQAIELTIIRDGKEQSLQVTLGERLSTMK